MHHVDSLAQLVDGVVGYGTDPLPWPVGDDLHPPALRRCARSHVLHQVVWLDLHPEARHVAALRMDDRPGDLDLWPQIRVVVEGSETQIRVGTLVQYEEHSTVDVGPSHLR